VLYRYRQQSIARVRRKPTNSRIEWARFDGGGGFGSPLARPAVDVAHDALERWISIEAAEHVYGVVLSADGSADITASEALRNKMSVVVF